jgi:hypothetical protein
MFDTTPLGSALRVADEADAADRHGLPDGLMAGRTEENAACPAHRCQAAPPGEASRRKPERRNLHALARRKNSANLWNPSERIAEFWQTLNRYRGETGITMDVMRRRH